MKIVLAFSHESVMMTAVKRQPPMQTCPKCDGQGRVPISHELLIVLNEVKRRRGATAPMVHDALDRRGEFGITAFNNRLNMLVDLGYLSRRKSGKTWFYSTKGTK